MLSSYIVGCLQVGQLIGSDALVQTYKARTYSARAITYIECSRLDREQLFQVLESWPDMRKRFRLLAIKVRSECMRSGGSPMSP
jgi:CRP-like cAMP-binding protein